MSDQPDPVAPPGAIPPDKLLPGLRNHLQKGEHVLWQGRGSGRAFDAFNRNLLIRFALMGVGVALVIVLMLSGERTGYDWVAWVLVAILLVRLALFLWQSSATPSRQVAMLTTRRVLSTDMLKPMTTWSLIEKGEGRADGRQFEPQPIVVTGGRARGHIRLNRAPQNTRAYPPFILFNVENPLAVAERIRATLEIDQPIEDRTK